MELSLTQIFGISAIETGQSLIINKADFVKLSASSVNKSECLLVAILLNTFENYQGYLTDNEGNKIIDNQGIAISYDNSILYSSLSIELWEPYLINRNDVRYRIDGLIIKQYSEYADTEFS
jgi:hypothetical protein